MGGTNTNMMTWQQQNLIGENQFFDFTKQSKLVTAITS